MTIISNNCSSAQIYWIKHIQYNHPFMWCISDVSYIDLYKNLFSYNYQNVEFSLFKTKDHSKKEITACKCCIDNSRCTTYYMHYITDPTKKNGKLNMNYNSPDILEYCKRKYYDRVNRMKNNDNIYFVIDMYHSDVKKHSLYPFVTIQDFELQELSKYSNVWCYTSSLQQDEHVRDCFKSNNLIVIEKDDMRDSTSYIANHFIEKYLGDII